MKFEFYLSAILLLGRIAQAHEFKVNDDVSSFVKTYRAQNLESTRQMRNGGVRPASSAKLPMGEGGGRKIYKLDRTGLSEENRSEIWNKAKTQSRMNQEITENEGGDEVYILSLPDQEEKELFRQNWVSKPNKTVEQLEAIGKARFPVLFPKLSSEFVFANNEVEYESIKDETVITEIKLRFARLVDNTQLFGNVSYLEMTLDGRGAVKRVRLKYPKIVETGITLMDARNEATLLEDLSKHCNAKKHLEILDEKAMNGAKGTTVKAAVKAWIPIEKPDGSVELTPGMGFFAEMELEDSKVISKTILVPFDKSLSVDDKRMKKTYSFADNNPTLPGRGGTFAPVLRSGRK